MKLANSTLIVFSLLLALWGCGKNEEKPIARKFRYRTSSLLQRDCTLKFPQNGLCSEIKWISGPSADSASSFEVTFWNIKNENANPLIEPAAQVGAFIRMSCCGSLFFPKVSKLETGKYLVSDVKFTPGKWEVYVQLKNNNLTEKQFLNVNLDD